MSGEGNERDVLDELVADGELDRDLLSDIAGALASRAADGAAKKRLLDRVKQGGRLHRFADTVAEMLDIDDATARTLLDGIDQRTSWEASPLDDVTLYHVEGGESVKGAITGFVRIPPGGVFPEHDHSGDEKVLIVQGHCRDTYDGRILAPGDIAGMSPSSGKHSVEALAGPPLVYLAVVFEGITVGGQKLGPYEM